MLQRGTSRSHDVHLDQVTIHHFRGLSGIAFGGLRRVNLIVGPNDTGKTSLLEALALYSDPANALNWITTAGRRDLEGGRSPVDALRWLFPQQRGGAAQRIHIASEGAYAVRECRATYTPLEGTRGPDASAALSEAGFSALISNPLTTALLASGYVLAPLTGKQAPTGPRRGAQLDLSVTESGKPSQTQRVQVWDDQPLIGFAAPPPALPVQLILPFSHRLERLPVEQLSQATIAGFDQEVLRVMQMVDPLIERVEILAPAGASAAVWLHHRQVGIAPLSSFGDGVRRSLFYALALPLARGGLLLIDELETAIHVSAIGQVFGWLVQACQDLDVQLFATTHSLEAVDAVVRACRPSHLSDVVTYQIRDVAAGGVERFGGEELETLRFEMGLDVRGGGPAR